MPRKGGGGGPGSHTRFRWVAGTHIENLHTLSNLELAWQGRSYTHVHANALSRGPNGATIRRVHGRPEVSKYKFCVV